MVFVFVKILFGHFPKRQQRINTQKERKLGKFESVRRLPFVKATWLIKLKAFPQVDAKQKYEGGVSVK